MLTWVITIQCNTTKFYFITIVLEIIKFHYGTAAMKLSYFILNSYSGFFSCRIFEVWNSETCENETARDSSKVCFRQFSILAGITVRHSFHQDHYILLVHTGFSYRNIPYFSYFTIQDLFAKLRFRTFKLSNIKYFVRLLKQPYLSGQYHTYPSQYPAYFASN